MPEWLYEAGIGEGRAALVADGAIVEAILEIEGTGPRVGLVTEARLIDLLPGRQGRVRLATGDELLLTAIPPGTAQGATLTVEVTREAIPEPGRAKLARAIPSPATPRPAPTLFERLAATGVPVRRLRAHEPDLLEAAGWSELLDEAMEGEIVFATGALRLSPTPAMTLFDVDGHPPLDALAVAAAGTVARAILRMGIGGSIGIDFPTLANKAQRIAVSDAIDAALPLPLERTAMNGFGFLQIVRPRPRASLPELLRADRTGAAARAALRLAERTPPGAPVAHRLPAPVIAYLAARPHWLAELTRRTGVVHSWQK